MTVHGYTYPNASNNPDETDVLRNRLGLRSQSRLQVEEYRLTLDRIVDLRLGEGPSGRFDADHLKAIHRHIFQDVYEWAGHMRHERPVVDGAPVEPIGTMRKGSTLFLPGSHIAMGLAEAFRPIRAGKVLNELNFVHPFREGNGRTQEAFIAELGRHSGHNVDLSVITKARMVSASIAGTQDPDHLAMTRLLIDATDPAHARVLKELMQEIGSGPSAKPLDDLVIRTAALGETVTRIFKTRSDLSGAFETPDGIVAVPVSNLRNAVRQNDCYTITVQSGFNLDTAAPLLRLVLPPSTPTAFRQTEKSAKVRFWHRQRKTQEATRLFRLPKHRIPADHSCFF